MRGLCVQGGGNYKGHGEVRKRGHIRVRQTDGRQEDERGRKSERERGGQGSRDWVWQRCERTGHAHIRRGHDSTCRLSPAGSTLCTAMLFWLPFSSAHTRTRTDKQIQLPLSSLPHSPSLRLISRHTLTHRQTHTSSHPKCHGFG